MDSRVIPLARPWLETEEVEAVARTIRSGWITQGPEVAAFEKEFAAYVGASFACAVSNCTSALYLALRAVGVGPGDEVITASHSFIATANAIRHCGAIPVFVDIEPETFNMDASLISANITPRTRAILCVHQMGMPCDLAAISKIAVQHSLPVIEDAACAAGSEVEWNGVWERIGRPRGGIACFSFHPRKILSTGDGGMLTTTSESYDRAFRLLRHQGMSVGDLDRHHSAVVIFESYPVVGFNFRLTDVQAAIGREQLKRLPAAIQRRRQFSARYREMLRGIPGAVMPVEPSWARSNWQSFAVRLPTGVDQRRVMQALLDDGIQTRRGIMCAHREPAYEKDSWRCRAGACDHACPPGSCEHLRQSERAQDETILLPLFHEMTESEQDRVVNALVRACHT